MIIWKILWAKRRESLCFLCNVFKTVIDHHIDDILDYFDLEYRLIIVVRL